MYVCGVFYKYPLTKVFEFICTSILFFSARYCFLIIHLLCLLQSFQPPLWQISLSPNGESFDNDIPFRTECYKISQSLHCPVVRVFFISSHLLQQKASLMMAQLDSDPMCIAECHQVSLLCTFSTEILFVFPPGPGPIQFQITAT